MPRTDRLRHFMIAWPFPVVVISILLSMISFFVIILLIPQGSSSVSAFATDFKTWCFDYDPLTGEMEWGYVYMYLVQPFIIAAVVFAIWNQPMKELRAEGYRKAMPYVLGAVGFVLVLVAFLPYVGSSGQSSGQPLFSPEKLRTEFFAPPFTMVDQDGITRSLRPSDGKITIVTGVYSTCGETCPLIVQQLYRVMYRLTEEEKSYVRVYAITLDPEVDTPIMMKGMLTVHKVDQTYFKGLTGDPEYVSPILDAYQFARKENSETGVLEHVNLINVVDTEGRLAFRFTLGNRQEEWLEESLRYLIAELRTSEEG